ncbi:hypothetical protein K435DRAFT_812375, partial [Dendrothele bispora CBS 962.96]
QNRLRRINAKGIEVYIFEKYDHVKQKGKGVLTSPLIIKTFAKAHYAKPRGLAALNEEMHLGEKPIGAVLLCVISIARALGFWRTGSFQCDPKCNPAHQFSAKNWGDTMVMQGSHQVPHLRSTKYLATLESREDKWWDEFYEKVRNVLIEEGLGGDGNQAGTSAAVDMEGTHTRVPVVFLSDSSDEEQDQLEVGSMDRTSQATSRDVEEEESEGNGNMEGEGGSSAEEGEEHTDSESGGKSDGDSKNDGNGPGDIGIDLKWDRCSSGISDLGVDEMDLDDTSDT